MVQSKSLILTGPTGVGKSGLAIQIALEAAKRGGPNGGKKIEIINADSVAFYKHFDIGTAKPTPEEQQGVPHHLLSILEPEEKEGEEFTAAKFYRKTLSTIQEIESRGAKALIVGGSGMYLKTLLFGLWEAPGKDPVKRLELEATDALELFQRLEKIDSVSAKRIGPNDKYRLVRSLEIFHMTGKTPTELQKEMPVTRNENMKLWLLERDKPELEIRLKKRIQEMLDQGWVEETRNLKKNYPNSKVHRSVGYAQINDYIDGLQPKGRAPIKTTQALAEEIFLGHRYLAKGQRTWFKTMPADHVYILDKDRNRCIDESIQFF